ncbi:MAG: hypothetical protein ACRECO_20900 [Xanthobacteraceae bacterium]
MDAIEGGQPRRALGRRRKKIWGQARNLIRASEFFMVGAGIREFMAPAEAAENFLFLLFDRRYSFGRKGQNLDVELASVTELFGGATAACGVHSRIDA